MATANEIALDVLRVFGPNVVERKAPMTYGTYAAKIGRNSATDGLAVGKAMHAIGAVCVVQQIPVAPLYWVARADGTDRAIFESDELERHHVIDAGNFNTMLVVAREYRYSLEEFDRIERSLKKLLESANPMRWSPHVVWHLAFQKKPKGSALTYFERAMLRYAEIFNEIKAARGGNRRS